MIDWNNISDEEMRANAVRCLSDKRIEYLRQEKRETDAINNAFTLPRRRLEAQACARYSRRQAAHYQQAIELLTAAPMPARAVEEET